jgi:glycogen debranching enzyme
MGLLAEHDTLLRTKMVGQETLIGAASRIETPESGMDRAYSLQNLCMDMLTLEMPGVARGAVAGLPSFAWFFGCDTYYSIGGLLVAGQAETAISTLRLLANNARRQGGRIPHEITPTGRLFNPGNSVETAQFVTSVERAYRWTGDRAFLQEMYGVCKEGIFDYLLGECDPEHTYLPDGPGLLELRSAGRGRKLDVAAALHQGLRSLAYLAASVSDPETVARCEEVRLKVREGIDRRFWVADRDEYVWRIEQDLSVWPEEPAHSYVMMEMGVLDGSNAQDAARLTSLFRKVEGPEHTGSRGMIHPGTTDFVMPIQNAIVALAELQYSRPDHGLWYLQRMSDLCGQAMPWAIPEFEAPEGSDRACFLQLWSSAAYNWLMVQGWFRLQPDPDRGVVLVRPQLPSGWQSARVRNLTLWGNRYDLSLQRAGNKIEFSATPLTGGTDHPFRVESEPGLVTMFV